MTFFGRLAIALFVLATTPWLRVEGGISVLPQGRLSDGKAIEAFLNATLPSYTFDTSKPCEGNQSHVRCGSQQNVVVGLNFSDMNLTGTIPEGSIGNLTGLESLDLSSNGLKGIIPEDFGNLSNLTLLNLSYNSLHGTFASYVQSLSALQKLDFSFNSMTGNIPELDHLGNLSVLCLRRNSFLGGIHDEHFPASLTDLDLTSNNLSGPIPPSLFNRSSLLSLKLANNQLSGRINVTALTAIGALQFLDLSNNSLSGRIPNLNEHLRELYLNQNGFDGTIPDPFPANLSVFDLHDNELDGEIPRSIPTILSVFDLHGNQLEGNITELIDSVNSEGSVLTILDLSSNNFSLQSFPSDFSHLINLARLGLADNKFLGHSFPVLPTEKLETLNLTNTNMSGNIPDSICNVTSLVRLDLSDNNLDGSIPTRMGALYNLELLDLSRNGLSGQFPPDLNNLTFLGTFNVSSNNLTGPIPDGNQFGTFSNTSFLNNPGLCGVPLPNCPSGNDGSVHKGNSKKSGPIIAGLVTGFLVILVVCAAFVIWCRVFGAVKPLAKDEIRHVSGAILFEKDEDVEIWATGIKDPSDIMVVMFEKPLLNLSFADLLQATANFSKEMQIADGGYGPVYKGVLPDATQLAIKVLVEVGFSDEKKAAARIEGLAKVKHSNLVPLIGYCLVGEDTVLVYDYMANGDLQRWLHELPEGTRNPEDWSRDTWEQLEGAEISGEYLNWPTRHKIALGTARALAFLHHGCSPHVIHRDVKSSNILLDNAFDAHLVDSGLAGIARMNGTPIIGGTLGYVPPEYGQTWQATTRGDVYSFGVVLLELVTGRMPTGHYFHDSHGGNLVGWVRSMIRQDKRGKKALDPKLVSRGYVVDMLETLRIGYLCTAETPAKRPTMQQVVGLLKDCQSSGLSLLEPRN